MLIVPRVKDGGAVLDTEYGMLWIGAGLAGLTPRVAAAMPVLVASLFASRSRVDP